MRGTIDCGTDPDLHVAAVAGVDAGALLVAGHGGAVALGGPHQLLVTPTLVGQPEGLLQQPVA